jgi:hypothetical protein
LHARSSNHACVCQGYRINRAGLESPAIAGGRGSFGERCFVWPAEVPLVAEDRFGASASALLGVKLGRRLSAARSATPNGASLELRAPHPGQLAIVANHLRGRVRAMSRPHINRRSPSPSGVSFSGSRIWLGRAKRVESPAEQCL